MCSSEANATSGSGNDCYTALIERWVFGRIIAGVDRGIQLGRLRSIRNEGANWRQLSRNGFGSHFAGGWVEWSRQLEIRVEMWSGLSFGALRKASSNDALYRVS